MRQSLTRDIGQIRWVRLLLIAATTWFIASALIAPGMNPLTRGWIDADMEVRTQLGLGWGEMSLTRALAQEYWHQEQRWPASLEDLDLPASRSGFVIDLPEPFVVRATGSDLLPLDSGLRGTRVEVRYFPERHLWVCSPAQPPMPGRWLPADCQPAGTWGLLEWLVAILSGALVLLATGTAILLLQHPLLAPLQKHPQRLLRVRIDELPRIDQAMRWLRRRGTVLSSARVDQADWQDALNYAQGGAALRAHTLALRIAAQSAPSGGWSLPGEVYSWRLPPDLPVGLDRCLAWFPDTGSSGKDLVRHLRALQAGHDVLLIFCRDADSEAPLMRHAADRSNLCVALDRSAQTQWLLGNQAVDVMLTAMAAQLKVTRISPYQTRGGVSRPSAFFGREQLLARVVGREPANYLVVGGRQLGKTSLLKAIERRFDSHPRVRCHYLSLRDERLSPRLASEFGLPASSSIEQIVAHLRQQTDDQRWLILIDEADLFVRADARAGYPQLSTLRALSDEGSCHFMLAGFWDLFDAATLDYQSPLRNFGEVISIGELELEACHELATVPLSRLQLRFEHDLAVRDLVDASGQRANLVAILCQECLELMAPGERQITQAHVEQAKQSQAVLDALTGWARLSQDERACRIDRIIVYRVAQIGTVRVRELVEWLHAQGAGIDIEDLRRSLARLQLAFVLRRNQEHYRFAVPLFERQFDSDELGLFIEQELQALIGRRSGQAGG